MASVYLAVRNQALAFPICLFPQSTNPTEYLDSPTLASGDFTRVGYDSAGTITLTKASLASTPTVSPASSGNVVMLASATEMDNDIVVISWKDVAGAEWCSGKIIFLTVAHGIDTIVSGGTGTNQISLSSGLVTLADGSLTAAKIAADAITAAKIADGAIDAATFAAGAINAAAIATDAITNAKIAADAIGASELAADAVAEIQSGLATPTNITAGTITTVGTVTNPVSLTGDLTATMKTSVTTAATAATPTAAAVTGSVGGNVTGSVGSVSSAVTVGTINANVVNASALATDAVAEIQSGLATATNVTSAQSAIQADVAAVKSDTGSIATSVAALPSASAIVTALMAYAVETGKTLDDVLQEMYAVIRGKAVADDATTPTQVVYYAPDDTTPRVTHGRAGINRTVS